MKAPGPAGEGVHQAPPGVPSSSAGTCGALSPPDPKWLPPRLWGRSVDGSHAGGSATSAGTCTGHASGRGGGSSLRGT